MPKEPVRRAIRPLAAAGGAVAPGGLWVPRRRAGPGPGIRGDFAANRSRILPQVVPESLLAVCRASGRELVTVPFPGQLAVAFVVDEEERYYYITRQTQRSWRVSEAEMLAQALGNLRETSQDLVWKQIGTGPRTFFLCETFDGYDASRILLVRELTRIAGRVAGSLVVGIPHRDYMIALGDGDPAFVAEIAASVHEDFQRSAYPITPELFTLDGGRVTPYKKTNEQRFLN